VIKEFIREERGGGPNREKKGAFGKQRGCVRKECGNEREMKTGTRGKKADAADQKAHPRILSTLPREIRKKVQFPARREENH